MQIVGSYASQEFRYLKVTVYKCDGKDGIVCADDEFFGTSDS